MPVAINIGGVLVDVEELNERRGQIEDLVEAARGGGGPRRRGGATRSGDTIEFSTGSTDLEAMLAEAERTPAPSAMAEAGIPQGPPVAFGQPLHIEMITAYTGKTGRRREADLLVASAVKNAASHGAEPKAINQVFKGVSDGHSLKPGAFNPGSPTVYYSPALDEASMVVGADMVLDSFDDLVFTTLSGLLGFAASIPIFAPASVWLMAGSQIVRMAGNLGNALKESGPLFRTNYPIRFNDPWFELPNAGLTVLWPDGLPDAKVKDLNARYTPTVDDGGRQVYLGEKSARQAPYEGEVPYMIVNLNVSERPELKGFKPQHASAALLEQFYGSKDGPGPAVVGVLKDALTLYNDLDYQKKALAALDELERLRADPAGNADAIKEREKQYAMYLKNILNDDMRGLVEARAESG